MSKILYLSLAVILILSFGIHMVEFSHVHHHTAFEEGPDAIRHSNEQRWLTLFMSLFAFVGIFLLKPDRPRLSTPSNGFISDIVQIFEPTAQALRLGIIHPKICN